MKNLHIEQMKSLINELSKGKYLVREVFFDFLKVSAIALRNSIEKNEILEQEYLDTIGKYTKQEGQLFSKILGELILALEKEGFDDVLGKLFMELDLGASCRGQYFTPFTVCECSADVLLSGIDEMIKGKNYITLLEPCSGAGGMVIAAAKTMYKRNYNPQKQMLCYCTDVDINAVYMTYIQLSILGIPAVITHGNSISMEEWSTWTTPFYSLFGWKYKTQIKDTNDLATDIIHQDSEDESHNGSNDSNNERIHSTGIIKLRAVKESELNKNNQKIIASGQLSFCI